MSKASLVALWLLAAFVPCTAQTPVPPRHGLDRKAAAEAPSAGYVRCAAVEQHVLFYVPRSWARTGQKLEFVGPDEAVLRVVYEKVPEGMSVKAYVAASVKSLRGVIGDNEPPEVRRIQMSGLDAREFTVESLSPERGRLHLRFAVAVQKTTAIVFVLVAPAAQATAVEPVFRSVVGSAALVDDEWQMERLSGLVSGDATRTPVPLAERQALVEIVDGTSQAARAEAAGRLATLCKGFPQAVADLLLDVRPVVRAAAVDAIGACGDRSLDDLLFFAVGDDDPFVRERAGRAIAARPDAVALLRDRYDGWTLISSREFLRIAVLLPHAARVEIADEILSNRQPPATAPAPAPKPPPPAGIPGGVPGGIVARTRAVEATLARELFALSLLADVPPSVYPIPFARLLAKRSDAITAHALVVAFGRGERVPVDLLLPLLASPSEDVFEAAVRCLDRSAVESDIARIDAARRGVAKASKRTGWAVDPGVEIDRAIVCTKLRAELARSGDAARREVVAKALDDAATADRLWADVASDAIEAPRATVAAVDSGWLDRAKVDPLGENLYPERIHMYTAAPDPQRAVERMFVGLQSAQLGSARDQANFALMLAGMRELVAQGAGLTGEELSFERLGLAPHDAMSLALWSAEGGPEGASSAARGAALVRVVDRDRFERLVSLAHEGADQPFSSYPLVAGMVARAVSLMPTLGPLAALDLVVRQKTAPPPPAGDARDAGRVWRSYRVVRDDSCMGVPVKVFSRRSIATTGGAKVDELWLAYAGDRAILAAGRASMRDVLARLRVGGPALGASASFHEAMAGGAAGSGDVVYLSAYEGRRGDVPAFAEYGALRVSTDGWENSFRISTPDASGLSIFEPFAPSEAAAPRDLLPRSTVIYAVGRVNPAFWSSWGRALFGPEEAGRLGVAWAVDYEREVLPELDRECGAAMLELPGSISGNGWPDGLVVFFKLRSDRLAALAARGPLLKKGGRVVAAVKGGFLILCASPAALARLDEPDRLVAAPDYARATKGLPDRTIAFGGYNVEAALARFDRGAMAPETQVVVDLIGSLARAFNRQGFWVARSEGAGGSGGQLDARLAVGFDHEGGHVVSELSDRTRDFASTFATIDTKGVPVTRQERVERLTLRIRSTAPGTLDRIREDIASETTTVTGQTADELVATILPRRPGAPAAVKLPVADPAFAPYLRPSREVRSDAESVQRTAREIAGRDRDAWSVARKLATWTHQNLKWKRVDEADAVDTLATREADCLEFSELYVAMARSLGLPARVVSGVAYSGGAFGGHAWVEVWAGRWIELDPTWGTEFVDATHVRTSSNSLVAYASLNLIDIEVLEAPREVPEYGRDPARLAAALCDELSSGSSDALSDALDPEVLADVALGTGGWAALDARGRRGVLGFYARLMLEVRGVLGSGDAEGGGGEFRLVNAVETGDRATALVARSDGVEEVFLRLHLARRGVAWSLVEVENVDLTVDVVGEIMRPAFDAVRARRRGEQESDVEFSPVARALALSSRSSTAALTAVDDGLVRDPANRQLRHLRATYLAAAGKRDEALKVWSDLATGDTPYAASLFALGEALASDEHPDRERRAALYERYAALVPDDPRPHTRLAWIHEEAKENAGAEREYRAALALDSRSAEAYLDLAVFQLDQGRAADAVATVDAAPAGKAFDSLVVRLYLYDEISSVDRLMAAAADRVRASATASLYAGRAYLSAERPAEAMPLVRRAIELQPDDADARLALVETYRVQKDWRHALSAADDVLKADAESAGAYYERACALARLGRADDAMAALERSIALDEDYAYGLEEDADLASLAGRADFKALIPEEEQEQ